MSWRVTYINRDGQRVDTGILQDEAGAKSNAADLNRFGADSRLIQALGPQSVGTFRAEEDKPAPSHSEAFDLLAAENADLKAKLELATEREFYLAAEVAKLKAQLATPPITSTQ